MDVAEGDGAVGAVGDEDGEGVAAVDDDVLDQDVDLGVLVVAAAGDADVVDVEARAAGLVLVALDVADGGVADGDRVVSLDWRKSRASRVVGFERRCPRSE